MTHKEITARLRQFADADSARGMQRFFKTAPGEYGEGDLFLGVGVGPLRLLAREFQDAPLAVVEQLLQSKYHEDRALALLILVRVMPRAERAARQQIYRLYLRNTKRVNNWDLVDCSAEHIVGAYLGDKDRKPLYRLARARSLWERRIAIVATYHYIKRREFGDTLAVAGLLLADREDLIHKAVGWMLREVGKRDLAVEVAFLNEHYRVMPRTMLRYAIERFPEPQRLQYLRGEI